MLPIPPCMDLIFGTAGTRPTVWLRTAYWPRPYCFGDGGSLGAQPKKIRCSGASDVGTSRLFTCDAQTPVVHLSGQVACVVICPDIIFCDAHIINIFKSVE